MCCHSSCISMLPCVAGVYFNDSSKIIWNANRRDFDDIEKRSAGGTRLPYVGLCPVVSVSGSCASSTRNPLLDPMRVRLFVFESSVYLVLDLFNSIFVPSSRG